jgi:hypothetical protein
MISQSNALQSINQLTYLGSNTQTSSSQQLPTPPRNLPLPKNLVQIQNPTMNRTRMQRALLAHVAHPIYQIATVGNVGGGGRVGLGGDVVGLGLEHGGVQVARLHAEGFVHVLLGGWDW